MSETQVYISVNDGPARLIVDGNLRLFRQLLDAVTKQIEYEKNVKPAAQTGRPQEVHATWQPVNSHKRSSRH